MIQRADADYLARLFIKRPAGFWHRHDQGAEPFMPSATYLGMRIPAYVAAGRWCVACPSCSLPGGARSAQLAAPQRTVFFCIDCLNAEWSGAWLGVAWPEASAIAAIEAALEPRPFEARNWDPDETVGHLLVENVIYGGLVDTVTGAVAGDVGYDQQRVLVATADRLALTA